MRYLQNEYCQDRAETTQMLHECHAWAELAKTPESDAHQCLSLRHKSLLAGKAPPDPHDCGTTRQSHEAPCDRGQLHRLVAGTSGARQTRGVRRGTGRLMMTRRRPASFGETPAFSASSSLQLVLKNLGIRHCR